MKVMLGQVIIFLGNLLRQVSCFLGELLRQVTTQFVLFSSSFRSCACSVSGLHTSVREKGTMLSGPTGAPFNTFMNNLISCAVYCFGPVTFKVGGTGTPKSYKAKPFNYTGN